MLSKEDITVLSHVKISLRDKIQNRALMDYRSKDSDGTTDFNEFRSYVAGENLRHIDWNKYYNESNLYVRKYHKLEKPDFYIIPDFSTSMVAGNKIAAVKQFTASICYCLLNRGMAVKLKLGESIVKFTNRAQINVLFDKLNGFDSNKAGSTLNPNVLSSVNASNLIIISDFIFPKGYEQFVHSINNNRTSCSLFNLSSPQDRDPALAGNYRLRDSQTGKMLITKIDSDSIAKYKENREAYYSKIDSYCCKRNWIYREVYSEDNVRGQFSKLLTGGALVL